MEIILDNLSRTFNRQGILENINWKIEVGISSVVAGPNGSGKSTLLKILGGTLRPSSGTVKIRTDKDQEGIDPSKARNIIGLVSSEVNLYERLTVTENLAFFSALRGLEMPGQEIRFLLERFQLDRVRHQSAAILSTGMKQRLKLAFAVLHNPAILLLDEPASNLDEEGKSLVDDLVHEQLQKGIVVTATNDLQEVEKYGQSVLRLAASPPGGCP